jgi:hypothetical protein
VSGWGEEGGRAANLHLELLWVEDGRRLLQQQPVLPMLTTQQGVPWGGSDRDMGNS